MAMDDFLKVWTVVSNKHASGVRVGQSTVCIYPDPPRADQGSTASGRARTGTKVMLRYRNFGAEYPTFQNGHYTDDNSVVAIMSKGNRITFGLREGELVAKVPNTGRWKSSFEQGRWRAKDCSTE